MNTKVEAMTIMMAEAVKHMVAAGRGLACLSRHAVAQTLLDGHLVEIQTPFALPERRMAVVMHRGRRLGRATAGFLQHCGVSLPRDLLPV